MTDGLIIHVIHQHPGWKRRLPDCDARARDALNAVWAAEAGNRPAAATCEVSILLADDTELARLNATYRGKDGPTNVLSFPGQDADEPVTGAPWWLGDIALALDILRTEADAQDKTPGDHFSHLCVHGMLHLLGYDHRATPDAEKMEAREIMLLADLGIADPYGSQDRSQ